jgi:hypothetical protein
MADDPKKDDEKRDEVLRRMLGTKPAPAQKPTPTKDKTG